MKLWIREMQRNSARSWLLVLGHLKDHRAPGAPKAKQNITKLLRARRLPALIHNGGKP